MTIVVHWHHEVFDETASAIADMLYITLGTSNIEFQRNTNVIKSFNDEGHLYIIMGLHRMKESLPRKFIAIQSEQIGSKWFTKEYYRKLRLAIAVWDFSPKNVQYFKDNNKLQNIHYLPTRVPLGVFLTDPWKSKESVDVLFFGAMHPRRKKVEEYLKQKFKRQNIIFRYNDLFGEEREELINDSKIVLNIHYWKDSSLATHRIEYLCSKGRCVISETSCDPILDETYSKSIQFTNVGDIEGMASKIKLLLRNEELRKNIARSARISCMKRQFEF